MKEIFEWIKYNKFFIAECLIVLFWGVVVVYTVSTRSESEIQLILLYISFVLANLLIFNSEEYR